MISVLLAIAVLAATVLYFLSSGSAEEKKAKGPITLQDPTLKYPLPLISKEVSSKLQC